jgi:uncharacterized membrane-anchored protein YhcB (DUF1043 family)
MLFDWLFISTMVVAGALIGFMVGRMRGEAIGRRREAVEELDLTDLRERIEKLRKSLDEEYEPIYAGPAPTSIRVGEYEERYEPVADMAEFNLWLDSRRRAEEIMEQFKQEQAERVEDPKNTPGEWVAG